jgi:hypothetical protein
MSKLTKAQLAVLDACVTGNSTGRVGWPLADWEKFAQPACQPLIDAGLLTFRRLGGYPGVSITPAGRTALGASDE